MARPNINIKRCTDGLAPVATSLYPLGNRPYISGGNSSLSWITNGTLANGEYIEVRTDGTYNFGSPDRRFQNLKLYGKTIQYNGVTNNFLSSLADKELIKGYSSSALGQSTDANSPFNGVDCVQLYPAARHANTTHCFRGSAFKNIGNIAPGNIAWPIAYDPTKTRTTVAGDKFFATWYEYHESCGTKIQYMAFSGKTGTFNTGANSMPTVSGNFLTSDGWVSDGDPVTIVGARSTTGWVKYIDASFIYIELSESTTGADWGASDFNGAVVTGSSGSCTLVATIQGTNYFSAGALKSGRVYEGSSASELQAVGVIVGGDGSLTTTSRSASNNAIVNKYTPSPNFVPSRQWIRRVVWMDYTGQNCIAGTITGNTSGTTSVDRQDRRSTSGPALAMIGVDPAGGSENGFAMKYGELISYTSTACAVVSSSSTWAGVDLNSSEFMFMQNHKSSSSLGFRIHNGAFSSVVGKYLYVLRDPITPINTSGLLLTGA